MGKEAAHSYGTSSGVLSMLAPAVPTNTGHKFGARQKKTDRHPPPCWVDVHCSHSKALTRQPPPQPHHQASHADT